MLLGSGETREWHYVKPLQRGELRAERHLKRNNRA